MAPIQTLTDPVAIAAALTAAGIQIVSPKTLEPVTMSGDQIAEPSATLIQATSAMYNATAAMAGIAGTAIIVLRNFIFYSWGHLRGSDDNRMQLPHIRGTDTQDAVQYAFP